MSAFQVTFCANFKSHVDKLSERIMPSNRDGFDAEYEDLVLLDSRVMSNPDEFFTAQLGSNAAKNRYSQVLANEATRVRLTPLTEKGDGEYINANYINADKLFGVPFQYIATQGPMRNTAPDFWRMVWEFKVQFIVMLTAEVENGRVKCHRYWPGVVYESAAYGALSVTLLSENVRAESTYRTFVVTGPGGGELLVQHYCYMGWPDGSVPHNTQGLMDVLYSIGRQPTSTHSPIVVHCSGGIGRTGVFITFHLALALFQLEKSFDVLTIVKKLKMCRSGMVQRKDQYMFCYFALSREMQRMLWAHYHPEEAMAEVARQQINLHQQQQQSLPSQRNIMDVSGENILPEILHQRHQRPSAHKPLFPAFMEPPPPPTRGPEPPVVINTPPFTPTVGGPVGGSFGSRGITLTPRSGGTSGNNTNIFQSSTPQGNAGRSVHQQSSMGASPFTEKLVVLKRNNEELRTTPVAAYSPPMMTHHYAADPIPGPPPPPISSYYAAPSNTAVPEENTWVASVPRDRLATTAASAIMTPVPTSADIPIPPVNSFSSTMPLVSPPRERVAASRPGPQRSAVGSGGIGQLASAFESSLFGGTGGMERGGANRALL